MQAQHKPKVLYAIQGTGNGHMARAKELIPILKDYADVDIFLSGSQYHISLPEKIKYYSRGYSFFYSNIGSIDIRKTFLKNSISQLLRDVKHLPVQNYNLVITDFECISALAAKWRKIPCVNMSHQASFRYKESPRIANRNFIGEFLLQNFAPANQYIGFHFRQYHPAIYFPVIPTEIRNASPTAEGHYTVYLPSYSVHRIAEKLRRYDQTNWHIFSNGIKSHVHTGNMHLYPVDRSEFMQSMMRCQGVLTGGGFETPAEAMYMGKKIMSIPIKKQYEQQCNAEALNRLGYPIFENIDSVTDQDMEHWISADQPLNFTFDDQREEVIREVLYQYYTNSRIGETADVMNNHEIGWTNF